MQMLPGRRAVSGCDCLFFWALCLLISTKCGGSQGEGKDDAAREMGRRVWVEGGPTHVTAHAEEARQRGQGEYKGSLRVAFLSQGGASPRVVEVPIYRESVPDEVAASLFRANGLGFDSLEYIPVHNAINAIVRGEDGPFDTSKSRAREQSFSRPHPFSEHADASKGVFMIVNATFRGAPLPVTVLEQELPASAVQRASSNLQLDETERGRLVEAVERAMVAQLAAEEAEMARRLGRGPAWADDAVLETYMTPAEREGALPPDLWDEGEVQRELHRMQHPRSCRDRKALVFSFDRSMVGLAVNVHYITLLLNYCWVHDRTLIMADPDHWNYAGRDCTRGWGCFFEPLSNCSEADAWQPYTLDVRDDTRVDYRGYMYEVDTSSARILTFSNVDGPWLELMNRDEYKSFIPKKYANRGHLWWRSQLTRFVFRPKPFVLEYARERQTAMGWDPDGDTVVAGLHVRHGDKSWDVEHQASYFGGLAKYGEFAPSTHPPSCVTGLCGCIVDKAAALVASRVGQEAQASVRYFISTDDASVIEQAKRLVPQPLWDDDEPRYNGTHVYSPPGLSDKRWPGFPGNDENVDTFRYALDSVKSILLLARASVFVGTATSCFSRLVIQLRVAEGTSPASMGDEWTVDSDPRFAARGLLGWFMDP